MSTSSLKPQPVDLQELQQQQLEADGDFSISKEEKITGNQDSSYKLGKHAAHRIHLRLSRKVNDPIKKEYTTEEEVVELSPAEYERMVANGSFAGYDAQDILHDPRPSAAKKAADTPSGSGSDAKKPLRSLADAQDRYFVLVGKHAPDGKSFTELKEAITHFESGTPEGDADLAAAKEAE